MRKRRSEGSVGEQRRSRGVELLIVGVSCVMVLVFAGCKQVDGLVELEDMLERNQLKYEPARLSEASLTNLSLRPTCNRDAPRSSARSHSPFCTVLIPFVRSRWSAVRQRPSSEKQLTAESTPS